MSNHGNAFANATVFGLARHAVPAMRKSPARTYPGFCQPFFPSRDQLPETQHFSAVKEEQCTTFPFSFHCSVLTRSESLRNILIKNKLAKPFVWNSGCYIQWRAPTSSISRYASRARQTGNRRFGSNLRRYTAAPDFASKSPRVGYAI